jgi:hypothetical protein
VTGRIIKWTSKLAVKIQVMFFWVVMLCSVVVGYQHLREVHTHSIFRVKMSSDFMQCCRTPVFQRSMLSPSSGLRWKQCGPLKCWSPATTLHGITTQKLGLDPISVPVHEKSRASAQNVVLNICIFLWLSSQVCSRILQCEMKINTSAQKKVNKC